MQFPNAAAAKDFLVSKIVEQAQNENVSLSDAERKMLYFTEQEPTVANEVCEQFSDCDPEYEEKITNLLRAAYVNDKNARQTYKDAIRELRTGDHYLSTMAEAALKSRPGSFRDQLELLLWGLGIVAILILIMFFYLR